jgi:site-specific recombinase XerD
MAEKEFCCLSMDYVNETITLEKPRELTTEELQRQFLADAKIRGVSPATLRSYACHLKPFIEYATAHRTRLLDVTSRDLKDFIALQQEKNLSPVTINDHIRSFRHLFRWMVSEGWIEKDPSAQIKKLKEPKREKSVLRPEDVTRMLSACPARTFQGLRNRAMIRLMWDCGLRRTEVINARLEDLDLSGKSLGITGKGNKFATVPLSRKTIQALDTWLDFRAANSSPYLFITEDSNSLNDSYFTHLIEKIGKKAGIKVNAHQIRHSVITWLAEQGMEPFDLQAFARHEDITTTMGYIQKARLAKRLPEQHRRFGPGNKI